MWGYRVRGKPFRAADVSDLKLCRCAAVTSDVRAVAAVRAVRARARGVVLAEIQPGDGSRRGGRACHARCGRGRSPSAWSTSPIELHTASATPPALPDAARRGQVADQFERVCAREGKPVAWEDLVKGYEYEKGRFVVLTKEDFQTAALEKCRTVDIRNFVKGEEIDDRFFETPYYLMPAKGGERAYALLREAIRARRVGIATIVLREAQHLAALEVIGEAMVLTLMRFADELVDTSDFSFPRRQRCVRKAELRWPRRSSRTSPTSGTHRSTPTNTART